MISIRKILSRAAGLVLVAILCSGCETYQELSDGQKAMVWIGTGLVIGYVVSKETGKSLPVVAHEPKCFDIRPPGVVFPIAC